MMKVSGCMVVALVVVCMAAGWPKGEGVVSCGTVTSCLAPCVSYATGRGPLTQQCCGGVQRLNSVAQSTPDRQAACTCMKSIANAMKSINWGAVGGVPGKCGVNIPYKISPSTNCATVR